MVFLSYHLLFLGEWEAQHIQQLESWVVFIRSSYYNIRPFNIVTFTMFIFFEFHYFQRSFVFPLLMKGQSKMPISIIITGFIFNTFNAIMQGGWLFYFSPADAYEISWFWSPQFIIGTVLFLFGMVVNIYISYDQLV